MFQRHIRTTLCLPIFILVASIFFDAPFAHAWGNEGHRIINHLAATNLPPDAPSFLRWAGSVSEIEYLGPEPDRWRSPAEPELVAVQAPEHFIDLELADALGPLPHRRFDFEAAVFASGQRPEKIGLQPWQATEVWQRLKAAFREYRRLSAAHQDTHDVEQAVIFMYAHCTLAEAPDAALHGILVPLLGAAQVLKRDPRQLKAVADMREAIAHYPKYFDDPGWVAAAALPGMHDGQ